MYWTDTSTKDSPAIRLSAGIHQMAAAIIVVVHFNSIAHINFGRTGDAHGNGTFRLVCIIVTRTLDLTADRRYPALL